MRLVKYNDGAEVQTTTEMAAADFDSGFRTVLN
jgi:hypothetical protein